MGEKREWKSVKKKNCTLQMHPLYTELPYCLLSLDGQPLPALTGHPRPSVRYCSEDTAARVEENISTIRKVSVYIDAIFPTTSDGLVNLVMLRVVCCSDV